MKHSDLVVPVHIAELLKLLDFDTPCISRYTVQMEEHYYSQIISEQGYNESSKIFGKEINYNSKQYEKEGTFSAPFWGQVDQFLFEKFGLTITLDKKEENFSVARLNAYTDEILEAIKINKENKIKNEKT